MWDGFNHRKFPRVNLECEVSLKPKPRDAALSTVTENLGAGGVCVVLDRALERFRSCRIRLALGGKSGKIECDARVVWTVATREARARRTRFDTGIEFINLEPADQQRIRRFIEAQLPPTPQKK